MKNSLRNLMVLICLATGFWEMTEAANAQTTIKASTGTNSTGEVKATAKSKQTTGPFRGHLVAVNKGAKSVTVGKRVFFVTAETKILKAGKAATLDQAVVGEEASGGFKTADDGRLIATKLNLGPKMVVVKGDSNSTEKKKK
jgi:hypothetical protein